MKTEMPGGTIKREVESPALPLQLLFQADNGSMFLPAEYIAVEACAGNTIRKGIHYQYIGVPYMGLPLPNGAL